MQQVFVEESQVGKEYVTITGYDAHHLIHVVRLKIGEKLRVSTTGGRNYLCRVAEIGDSFLQADILSDLISSELPATVLLFQAIPKGERMEAVIEKTVELGVSEIIPVSMQYCVVKLTPEKATAKVRRWQAIAENAARQSKRSALPVIREVCDFSDALQDFLQCDLALLPYENERGMEATQEALAEIRPGQTIGIMIGPEGGFSLEEVEAVEHKARCLSLGKRILRTDTAAITAMSLVMLELEIHSGR